MGVSVPFRSLYDCLLFTCRNTLSTLRAVECINHMNVAVFSLNAIFWTDIHTFPTPIAYGVININIYESGACPGRTYFFLICASYSSSNCSVALSTYFCGCLSYRTRCGKAHCSSNFVGQFQKFIFSFSSMISRCIYSSCIKPSLQNTHFPQLVFLDASNFFCVICTIQSFEVAVHKTPLDRSASPTVFSANAGSCHTYPPRIPFISVIPRFQTGWQF